MHQPTDPNYNYIEVFPQMGLTSAEPTTGTPNKMQQSGQQAIKGRSCEVHKTEEMRLFCSTCNELVCQFCFLEHHRSHRVERLKDVIMRHKKKVVGIVQNLQLDLDKWQRFLSGLTQRESNLCSALKIEEEKVNRCVESIVQEVVAQKDRIIAELRQNEQPQFDIIEREKKQVNTSISKLTESITTSPINQVQTETDQEFIMQQLMFMSDAETLKGYTPPNLKNLDTRVGVSQFTSKTLPADIKVGKLKKSSYESHALIKPNKKLTRHDSIKNLSNTNLSTLTVISTPPEPILTRSDNYETSIAPVEAEVQESSLMDRMRADSDGGEAKPKLLRQKRVQIVIESNNATSTLEVKPLTNGSCTKNMKPVTKPKPATMQLGQSSPKGARKKDAWDRSLHIERERLLHNVHTNDPRERSAINPRQGEILQADMSRTIKLAAKDGFGRFQGASSISATPTGPIAVLDSTMYQIRIYAYHKGNKKYKQQTCFALSGDQEPQGIALTTSSLIVVAYKSGVDMYSASGKEKTTIFKTGHKSGLKYLFSEQQDNGVMSVAVTTKFVVLVGNVDTSRIIVLNPGDGTVIKILKTPIHPWYIATNDVHVAISDHLAEKLCVMEIASGRVIFVVSATRPKGIAFHKESRSLLVVQGQIVQGKIHQCSIEQYSSTTGEWMGQAVGDMGKGSIKDLTCTANGMIAVASTASVKLYNIQYVGARDSVTDKL